MTDILPHPPVGPRRETIMMLKQFDPDVAILDGGSAKIKQLDSKWYDDVVNELGPRAVRRAGMSAMEAEWIAASVGLLYVNPTFGLYHRWSWADIELVVDKRGRRFSRVYVIDHLQETRHLMQLGTRALDNLLAATKFAKASQPRTDSKADDSIDEWVEVAEAAQRTGMPSREVYEQIDRGELDARTTDGRIEVPLLPPQ